MKYIILFFSFLILVNGCIPKKGKATTQNTVRNIIPADTTFGTLIDTPLLNSANDTLGIDSAQLALQRAILPYTTSFIDTIETISMKGNFDYATPQKSFQAGIYVRIQRDSIIWLSVTYLGFEIIRVFATPQEVNIYNKVNGKTETMSFKQLLTQQNLPLHFSNPFQVIQSFFFGSYLIKHTDSIQTTANEKEFLLFNTLIESHISTLTTVTLKDKVYYPINIQIPEVLNYIIQINYGDWNLVKQNRYFSLLRNLYIYDTVNIRRPITALTIHFTDAKFNEKVSFPFPKRELPTP